MDWTLITILIPLIAFVIGGLVSYIFRTKDVSEGSTKETLKEIKDLITTVNLKLTSTHTISERNVRDTAELILDNKIVNSKLHELMTQSAIIIEARKADEKRLDLLQDIISKFHLK